MKEAYLIELGGKINKINQVKLEMNAVTFILQDLRNYLHQKDEPLVTKQQVIGMKYVFRGWVVKNWLSLNDEQSHVLM